MDRLTATNRLNDGGRMIVENPQASELYAPLTHSIIPQMGMGAVTYSRATIATVTDNDGIIRNCISGEARFLGARRVRNLFSYSQDFMNAAWTVAGITRSLHTETINGIPTFSLLNDATTVVHRIHQAQTFVSGNSYIASYYLKANTLQYAQIYISGVSNNYANFDLSAGTVSAGTAGAGSISSLGNGWYRCSLKFTATSGGSNVVNLITITSGTSSRAQLYLGTGVGYYASAGQLEDVTGQSIQTPSEYVSTNVLNAAPYHGSNVDGVKYFDTDINGIAIPENTLKGFLNEGTRTNLLLQSDNLAVTWAGTSASVTIDQAISPDGRMTMDKVVPSAANVAHFLSQGITTTANVYAYSIYAKANGYNNIQLWTSGAISNGYVNFNLANGTVGSSSLWTGYIEALPNGVYRCTAITNTLVATTASFAIGLISSPTAIRAEAWLPDGTNGVLVWGTQLELGQNSSSYIPTTTTTVTRNIDVLTYNVRNAIANQGALSVVCSMNDNEIFDRRVLNLSSFTVNRLHVQARTLGVPNVGIVYGDGVTVRGVTGVAAGTNNIAASWTNGVGLNLYMNNIKYIGAFVPSLAFSTIDVGGGGLGYPIFGCVKNVRIWKTVPTDAELLSLSNQS